MCNNLDAYQVSLVTLNKLKVEEFVKNVHSNANNAPYLRITVQNVLRIWCWMMVLAYFHVLRVNIVMIMIVLKCVWNVCNLAINVLKVGQIINQRYYVCHVRMDTICQLHNKYHQNIPYFQILANV